MAYQVERRAVKHFRLKVSEQGAVRLVAPLDASDAEVEHIFKVKQDWINLQLRRFGNQQTIALHQNHLLLFGERYQYFYCDDYKQKVIVNHQHKTIRAYRDLTNTKIQEQWLKQQAGDYIRERTQELSQQHQLSYNKIYIRGQRTKWGCCSSMGNLSFNWRLIKTPQTVIDYVILHELTHTKIMSHSNHFWRTLKSICPSYRESVAWLEKYGRGL